MVIDKIRSKSFIIENKKQKFSVSLAYEETIKMIQYSFFRR